MSEDQITVRIVQAIAVRDKVAEGINTQEWVREQVLQMVEEGFWNDSHIAAITGYARQSVSKMSRGAVRPAERPAGGTLDPRALDVILELRGAVLAGRDANAALVQAAIATGTSTKLIARLTGIGIGAVLYQQRKMPAVSENNS